MEFLNSDTRLIVLYGMFEFFKINFYADDPNSSLAVIQNHRLSERIDQNQMDSIMLMQDKKWSHYLQGRRPVQTEIKVRLSEFRHFFLNF